MEKAKYRWVEKEEEIQAGDEFYDIETQEWLAITFIQGYGGYHHFYRRKVESEIVSSCAVECKFKYNLEEVIKRIVKLEQRIG